MPSYQYRCEECGMTFERTETISEHDRAKPKCPKCGSKRRRPYRVVSTWSLQKRAKSASHRMAGLVRPIKRMSPEPFD